MSKYNIESTTDSQDAVTAAIGGLDQQAVEEDSKAVAPEEQEAETSEESAPLQSEEEQQQVDVEELEDSEDESEDDSEEDEEQEQNQQKPKRKNGFQRRIAKLNKRIEAKDLELEYWKKQAMNGQGHQEQEQQQETAQQMEANDHKPNPDDFEDQESYMEALTDWKVDQKLKAKETESKNNDLLSQRRQMEQDHKSRVQQYATENPDFYDALEDISGQPVSAFLEQIIIESDNGPKIMHELAKNPEVLNRLNTMDSIRIAREIGRMEASFTSQSNSSPKTEPKTSKAPRPLKPVKGKATSTKVDPEKMSFQEYKAWRQANG